MRKSKYIEEQGLIDNLNLHIYTNDLMIDDYKLHYVELGEGPDLLLLHGANIGWGQWYRNLADLSQQYKVYALDLPGCGFSSDIDYESNDLNAQLLNCVLEFINKVRINQCKLMGHSLGGWLGLKIAAETDLISSLVVINPVGLCAKIPLKYKLISIKPFVKTLIKTVLYPSRNYIVDFLTSAQFQKIEVDKIFVDYYLSTMYGKSYRHPLLLISAMGQITGLKNNFILIDDIKNINIPTQIIIGSEDELMPLSCIINSVKNNPNISLYILERSAHVPFIENPSEFNFIYKF